MKTKRVRNVAQIRRDPDLDSFRTECVADGIRGVMRDGETRDIEIAYRESTSGLKSFQLWKRFAPIEIPCRSVCYVDRELAIGSLGEGGQTGRMIAVFMRDEDRVKPVKVLVDIRQALRDLAAAQARVNEYARPFRRNKCRVTRAAAG